MFPLMGLLNRMIFWELLKVFFLSLVGLTALVLIAGIISEASKLGLSPGQLIEIIPLLIPTTLPYTIPATTLFASCVVYGRLSNDNETVAMKAAGLDLLTILRPAVLLGVLTGAATLAMAETIIPRSQTEIQLRVIEDPEEVLYAQLKRERRLKYPSLKYVVYVRDVQGKRLIDVVVKQRSSVKNDEYGQHYDYDFVARTREARLVVDMEARTLTIDADKWEIADGKTLLSSAGAKPPELPLPDSFDAKAVKSKAIALEWDEIELRFDELTADRQKLVDARAENLKKSEAEADPILKQKILAEDVSYREKVKEADRQIRTVQYEFHSRPALAFGCLCFALVGCPVGIWANRADYLSTFVICFLPVVFIYYPIHLAGSGLAREGKIPMIVGVWLANTTVGLAAIALTYRLIRR